MQFMMDSESGESSKSKQLSWKQSVVSTTTQETVSVYLREMSNSGSGSKMNVNEGTWTRQG